MTKILENLLLDTKEYKHLVTNIEKSKCSVAVTGVADIHKSHIICSLCKNLNLKSLVIVPNESEAQNLCIDMIAMGIRALVYTKRDFCFTELTGKSREYEYMRIKTLFKILDDDFDVIISSPDAALQYTIPPENLIKKRFKIRTSEEICKGELEKRLVECGYERYDSVDAAGQFSVRGGILDFFPPNEKCPIRVEFFGDEIDTISYFNLSSQRREESINEAFIVPASEVLIENKESLIQKIKSTTKNISNKAADILYKEISCLQNNIKISSLDKFIKVIYSRCATLFDYLPKSSVIFISEDIRVKECINNSQKQWTEDLDIYLSEGTLCKGFDSYSEDLIYMTDKLLKFRTVFMDTFAHKSYSIPANDFIHFQAQRLMPWNGDIKILFDEIQSAINQNIGCILLAGTKRYVESIFKELSDHGFNCKIGSEFNKVHPGEIIVSEGGISSGFKYEGCPATVMSHGNTFLKKPKKEIRKNKNSREIYDITELKDGNYVVHSAHGIGIFSGIHQIAVQGLTKDYIKLIYAKGDTLYVPVTQMDMISKYVGSKEDMHVRLNKLGGTEWKKTKSRVRAAVKDIAKELMRIYSERMRASGYEFPEDDEWQKDFESRFEYEETNDQITSINEIKKDMQKQSPMDRLLCGDVGFGKTEVALRAAFKCITAGKQCAMLVPTTILAWQHFQTVIKRFESFPIKVEILSRFRTSKQQTQIIRALKSGEIDFIIGTHRLVQNDIKFRDLGLVIIDEEQRFGVAHKEKFKSMAKNVDVLTLSATPIPRTLNMAMSGIRDMSTLEEAPQNRYPVQTYVMEYDSGVILESMRKELRRGGQVYYLHNRIDSIEQTAAFIEMQIQGAVVGIVHGRMSESELSEVWKKMIEHEINVLVCTTIIETGIDLPNANTLIIENADSMGLSQLHQIRGRVGRSPRRAYAYFTFRKNKSISEIAQKRLTAIRDFTEFGSGFKIAMRDLEIRGAGNIIGAEQHGNMEDVGYNMYLKLLGDAVRQEKGEGTPEYDAECLVDISTQASIPENYIKNSGQRIAIYRRISDIRTIDDAFDVIDEIIDRFSDIPKSVIGLINISLIRVIAFSVGICEIKQKNNFIFIYQKKFDMKALSALVKKLNGKASVNAGSNPYMSIRMDINDNPLQILNYIFDIKLPYNK